MEWILAYFTLSLSIGGVYSDTAVTIHSQWLAQGGSARYDSNRWNKHNGLDQESLIPKCRSLRTDGGRWNNNGLSYRLFEDWPEDPNRSGYPDPSYLKNATKQKELFSVYLANINTGYENDMIMMSEALKWPNWLNQSEHAGQFPNNVDAAAEFMMLMVQGVYDFTKGQIPPYIEPMNEPDPEFNILNFTTVALFHKSVAEKLHSRFNIKVAGPTLDGFARNSDRNNFTDWKKVADFMDVTSDYLDVFSFHSYNSLIVSGKSHKFTGMNEARLVAFVDLVENYAYLKKRKIVPLVISEYGRDTVIGIDKYAPSGIVDFSTIYHSNAHRFTQLGLREYIDRAVVFLLANIQNPYYNWSLFTNEGKPRRVIDVFEFWYKFTSDYSFIRTTSQYDGEERTVSPLAMSSSQHNETVILLHSYSQESHVVKLDFEDDWIKPTTGEATCVTIKDDWYPVITFNEPFDIQKTHGMVELPPEATCHFTFKTPSDQLPNVTLNETTYYGADTLIPIKGNIATTIISLPNGQYHSARLRVAASWPINETNGVSYLTFNLYPLDSFYKLYDANMIGSTTYWEVWEFAVPASLFVNGVNQIQVHFSKNMTAGYVSSIALVTAKLVPSDLKS
ncbi:beta-porphyranase A-like isoform X2 [Haliotis rufescens]|uniref:beta-porphyranase A-like isoform X2 n=1 Tax=Haliotis rufescens TaxID=6454 RepID=UPI00201EC51B|nr:beta-porphyranase A-like isoform X2 [Haliotis rufescens]